MTNHSDVLLIEHILNNTHLDQEQELTSLLEHQGIDMRIKSLSHDLEIFNQVPTLKPSAQLRQNILNGVSSKSKKTHKFSGFSKRLSAFYKLPLSRIDQILQKTTNVESSNWDTKMIKGASLLHFNGGPGLSTADCGLIHLTPGNGIGNHSHNGDEIMFVLKGELECSDNETYKPGDIIHRPKGSVHSVTVRGKQDCLFAVIADHGVTFL